VAEKALNKRDVIHFSPQILFKKLFAPINITADKSVRMQVNLPVNFKVRGFCLRNVFIVVFTIY
jgi:hypothetical protein